MCSWEIKPGFSKSEDNKTMAIRTLFICYITDSAASKPDAELVIGLHRQGIEADVMMPSGSSYEKLFNKLGIRVIPFHPPGKFSLTSIKLIRKNIRARKYNILHLFNSKAIVNGAIAAIGMPVKVIAYRGAAGMHWHDPTAWFSHFNPRIDTIICNSAYVLDNVRKQLLFNPGKAVMIHKGLDISWFGKVTAVSREVLGIPGEAIVVGCVANVRRIKGLPYLIRSTRYLDPELPVHFLLIGSGMDSGEMMRLIRSSPFRDRIHIHGFRKDVYELLAACDIYIQPSLSESLSRSVMEAMCLGVACIVSDTGGLTELVEHNKSGLIVEKGNARAIATAIEKLAGDSVLRKAFSAESVIRMEKLFSVNNMVAKTRELYESMLN